MFVFDERVRALLLVLVLVLVLVLLLPATWSVLVVGPPGSLAR